MARSARRLTEAFSQTSPLTVDAAKGIIFGVRCLGPESKNTHGVLGVEKTEYAESAHADACRLYEGCTVKIDHVKERGTRSSRDNFGILKNARTVKESSGPVTYADLHYLTTHDMAATVREDVEKGLGVYGLSHDAYAGKERVDRKAKKLVIESLASVRSVDIVDRAATNRTLWESQEDRPQIAFRSILEKLKSLPKGKAAWLRRLTEEPEMGSIMDAPADVASDADAQLAAGFRAAILAVLDDESLSIDEKKSRIGMLLETQDKLQSGEDPAEPPEADDMATGTTTRESVDTAAELAALKAENERLKADQTLTATVRQLCEAEKFTPTEVQLTALKALPDDKTRKSLLESFKPAVTVRSGYTGSGNTTETGEFKAGTSAFFTRIKKSA